MPLAFTLLAALWGQVEFRTKQLMPWKIMAKGPAPAKETLFLDYISPWNVLALVSSLRAFHFPVTLATGGSLLIKLLTVVSTGLLMLQSTDVHHKSATLVASNAFNGSGFSNASIDARPYSMVYAAQKFGSEYPFGTTDRYAYQTFNSSKPSISSNTTLSGVVDAFYGELSCNILLNNFMIHGARTSNGSLATTTVQAGPSTQVTMTPSNLTIVTPGCRVGLPLSKYSLALQTFFTNCDGRAPINFEDTYEGRNWTSDPDSHDILLHVIFRYHDDYATEPTDARVTTVYCKPSYNILRAYLTIKDGLMPVAQLEVLQSTGQSNRTLQSVSKFDLLNGVRKAILENSAILPSSNPPTVGSFYFEILNISNPQPSDSTWHDGELLKEAAERSFSPIAAQLAKFYLLVPANDKFTGEVTTQEARLFVRILSFALMEVVLVLLVAITVVLFFTAPRSVCSRDPSSIGGLATIVAPNDDLNQFFRKTGIWDIDALIRATDSRRYQTRISASPACSVQFTITEADSRTLHNDIISSAPKQVKWWRPFSSTIFAQVLVFTAPVALSITLELLYQQSRRLGGIADVNSDAYVRYAWVYLPALVMFGVVTLYGMIDFGARVFQPYSLLRRTAVPAQPGILNQQLGKFSLHSLWDSIHQSQIATAATTVAVILGGLLPIAVSGLYTASSSTFELPVAARQTDFFNFTISNDIEYDESAATLIVNANMSYPSWTFEDLAFPSLQFSEDIISNSRGQLSDDYTIDIKVPAVRVKTNCTVLGEESMKFEKLDDANQNAVYGGKDHERKPGVRINVTLPEYCLWPEDDPFAWEFPYGYFGQMVDAYDSEMHVMEVCAKWVIVYGYADEDLSNATATMLLCSPYYETVDTNITLTVPTYAIDENSRPVVDEKSARHAISFDTHGGMAYYDKFVGGLPIINVTSLAYPTSFDKMFSAIVYGRDGVPAPELAGKQNIQRLQGAFQHTFGIVEAQRANYEHRHKYTASSPPLPIMNGILKNPNRVRLVQSAISTRILEVILATMLVCAIVTFFAIDTRRTLPKNPCSIGAVISLLAGSEIMSESVIPRGSEWCDDKELERRGVFEGWLFSLGWWKETEGRRFGIGIGHAEKN